MRKSLTILTIVICIHYFCTSSYSSDQNNVTPQKKAFIAAKSGDLEGLKEALQNGAQIEARDAKYKDNVLNKAITKGHTHIVRWLLENGANPNSPGGGWIALHNAIFRDDLEQTKLLLEFGADIEAIDRYGSTPIVKASRTTRIDIFELLLAKGVDVNIQNKLGITALYYASENGSDEKARLLLEKGG